MELNHSAIKLEMLTRLFFFINTLTTEAIHSIGFVLEMNILNFTPKISVNCNKLGYRLCAA